MNRASFLRSLFVLGIAPKIISQLDLSPVINVNSGRQVFSDLNLLPPIWYKSLIKKYANNI